MPAIKPMPYTLNGCEVHLWVFNLDKEQAYIKQHQHTLSEDELGKAKRLRKPLHQHRAMAGKIQLRALLSKYLQCSATSIQFLKGDFGKPYIHGAGLSFNFSHSQNKALVAISQIDSIGVDIEYWRKISQQEHIVQRHYSAAEKEQWLTLAGAQKEQVFFDNWTRKEAFIKATGRGLGMGLSSCTFDLLTGGQLTSCLQEYGEPACWNTQTIQLGAGVSGSLMVRNGQRIEGAGSSASLKIRSELVVRTF